MQRMKRRLLILVICLLITGCGDWDKEQAVENGSSKDLSAVSGKVTQGTDSENWNPAIVQRQMLFDEGYVGGVLFLGYVDGTVGDLEQDREYYQSLFEGRGYLEDFPFLTEIPNSNFVQTDQGQELYCIIPQDDAATLTVREWIVNEKNDFKGEAGEILYHSESGSPILLKCNVSEIVPDAEIEIVDKEENGFRWCPSISGMDGSVFIGSAEGKLYDFTSSQGAEQSELLQVMVGESYDYYWSDEAEVTLASLICPYVKTDEKTAFGYPELEKALAENVNARKEKLYKDYEEKKIFAEEFYQENAEYFSEFKTEEHAAVRRADSHVLSILYSGMTYEGGAHGYYYYWGENYDTNTGDLLQLKDVVADMEALPALVQEQLETHWEPVSFYEDLDLHQHFNDNMDSIAWTMDYNGITFFFNPYEIAPYASGIQVATVAFADHPEVFSEKYTTVPESYGIQLNMEAPFYYDVDSDGELDELLVFGGSTEDESYVAHHIYIDEENFEETDENDIYAYEISSPHLVHLSDGRNYLFIENLSDNDMRTNTVYEVSDGTVKKVDTLHGSMHRIWDEEEITWMYAVTNPYHFLLDSTTWVVGTRNGYRTYYMGEDGQAYSYEDYYTFDSGDPFVVLKDFSLELLDEYGNACGSVEIKAGESVIYYRTDASVFADFILPDGQIGRAELEWYEGACSINGTRVDELFEGVIFAG